MELVKKLENTKENFLPTIFSIWMHLAIKTGLVNFYYPVHYERISLFGKTLCLPFENKNLFVWKKKLLFNV